ncbi:MAG: PD40 domain-containing protein [Acidobacteria bacterium]|nr:PD40 domain-containing protein [Acidobacteriota bacterium]
MNPERWKQIDDLFDIALDLPEAEREAFLSENCGGDAELEQKLRELLRAAAPGEFLERSAMRIAAENLAAATSAAEADFVGMRIGNYRIERQIGAGGMGEVYLARDEKLHRAVALKILPAEYTSNDERVKRFELEARAISALNHPNIVTIHDVGNAAGINYIATEFVEGRTLRELIDEKPSLAEILAIMIQVCEALSAAHGAGIIHRDIKPENIMLRPDGYVKVLDFGLVKLSGSEPPPVDNFARTAKGIIIGTPAYMSPEQVTDDRIDHRTDLWSVGVVLYELLTGFNPYKKETRQATFQSILLDEPPLASTLNREVSGELDRILYKALEKDPSLSYQTAADLRADLRRVRREFDSSAGGREDLSARRARGRARRAWFAAAVVLFLLAAGGAAFWYFGFYRNRPPVDWSKARTLPLTEIPGSEIFPTLSPDGKSFVYAAKSERGDYDLFWQRVGEKRARSLTEDSAADETMPAFSPDGERLAFRSEKAGEEGIYVMSAGGENRRRVADFGFHPAWSPDGKELVVSTQGKELPDTRNGTPSELWIVSAETGAKRLLSAADALQPAWSPDGRFIAYWFYPPNVGRRDVGIVPVAGGEPTVITSDGTTNWNPVWSPDGRYLYFASDRGGNMRFWRVAFHAGKFESEPEPVVTPSKYSRHLAFSADGTRLIFVATDVRSNLQAVAFNPATEKTVGEPFWITRGDRQIQRPELSPDGTQFVFSLSRQTQDDIVIVSRDGANQRDLTKDAAFDRYPRWSPDGRRIAFASDRSGVYEIWTIDADGTNLRQITFTGREGTSFPIWSPDGKRLLYRIAPQSRIIDLSDGADEQTSVTLPVFDPADRQRFVVWDWSPDGTRLAGSFSGSPMKAGIYSLAGNRFEPLDAMDSYPMWLPDNRRIVYGHNDRIFITDTETKRTRELDFRPAGDLRDIGISRDGRLLYYTLQSGESDIWLLDAAGK